jgi:hypothetical protein
MGEGVLHPVTPVSFPFADLAYASFRGSPVYRPQRAKAQALLFRPYSRAPLPSPILTIGFTVPFPFLSRAWEPGRALPGLFQI